MCKNFNHIMAGMHALTKSNMIRSPWWTRPSRDLEQENFTFAYNKKLMRSRAWFKMIPY